MHRFHLAGLALLLLVCGLALAACGSNSTSSAPATTTTGTSSSAGTSSAALAKYTDCLKQHGVTRTFRPGGPNSGGGAPTGNRPQLSAAARKTFQAAQTACSKYRPAGAGNGFPGGPGNGAASSAFAAYSNCLKLHGVTVTRGTRPAATSTKAKAALAACAALRPVPGNAPSSPSN